MNNLPAVLRRFEYESWATLYGTTVGLPDNVQQNINSAWPRLPDDSRAGVIASAQDFFTRQDDLQEAQDDLADAGRYYGSINDDDLYGRSTWRPEFNECT